MDTLLWTLEMRGAGLVVFTFAAFVFSLLALTVMRRQSAYATKLSSADSPVARVLKWVLILSAVLSALFAVVLFFGRTLPRASVYFGEWDGLFVDVAFAANGNTSGVATLVPYILGAVFVSMILAFAISLWFLLTVPDSAENERRLSAADNVVKSFGGFFIGFATSLLNITPS